MTPDDENKKLRDLLRRMREEADEAWRNGDPLHAARHRAKRDPALRDEVAELLGPAAWDLLEPSTHIAWGAQAICHWTFHAPAQWPPTQTCVRLIELVARLPSEDEMYVEYVARPDADWNGVTCNACRVRLPTLLRELSRALDDVQEGIMEGLLAHPETIRARGMYMRDVEPKLTAEQRQRHEEQVRQIRARDARRAARRARLDAVRKESS